MRDELDTITELKATYECMGGAVLRSRYLWESCWVNWRIEGYRVEDLKLVMRFIDWWNRKNPNFQFSKAFNKIIGDLHHFANLKARAESWERERATKKRQPVNGERERILAATGRPPITNKPAVHVGAVDWRKEWDKMKASISGGAKQ